MRLVVVLTLLAACTSPTGTVTQGLSTQTKHDRYQLIRDTAAQMGVYNGPLLAGIAISETGLAHCNSEVTYGCPGPASPSCNGNPILAGGADGPCSAMQGGLGMFQFDAGTYADTVATYGPDILTIEGNSAQAVWFVIDKVEQDIPNQTTWLDAAAWMNAVPLSASDPTMNQWAALLACRYNGCCSTSSLCTTRANGYRDNALMAYSDMGADFWNAVGCKALPADGVIAVRSACYVAGGDPRYWHHDAPEWTKTSADPAPANFGEWIIKVPRAGRYHVDVDLEGGTSKQAAYTIVHGGASDTVVVDQTSATGYVTLGDFDFSGTGDEHVLLGDNTGEAGAMLAFTSLRVESLDAPPPPSTSSGCGCQARGGGAAAAGGAFVLFALVRPRKRRSAR
ncbi:MAG TPA: hypothetical protein VLT45_02380 [Kofleriaceae bacterium]|nr:hypothetical protein [Kofleriaceae bacterium]